MFKFFDLYSNFDYNSMFVSPYLGNQFTKDTFGKSQDFSVIDQMILSPFFNIGTTKKCRQIMPTYAYLVDSGKASPLRFDTPLVVQARIL